jgi:hypothetical protein
VAPGIYLQDTLETSLSLGKGAKIVFDLFSGVWGVLLLAGSATAGNVFVNWGERGEA